MEIALILLLQQTLLLEKFMLVNYGHVLLQKALANTSTTPLSATQLLQVSTSLKGLLLLGILQGHQPTCLDISTAFINTPLPPTEPPIHVQPPAEWYYDQPTTLWRLRKAMYGLRTSPKLWQQHLGAVLRQQNLRQCKADRCLWTTPGLGVLIYVDDLLLVGEATKIQQFHIYLEGYLHVEACDYPLKRARHTIPREETTVA